MVGGCLAHCSSGLGSVLVSISPHPKSAAMPLTEYRAHRLHLHGPICVTLLGLALLEPLLLHHERFMQPICKSRALEDIYGLKCPELPDLHQPSRSTWTTSLLTAISPCPRSSRWRSILATSKPTATLSAVGARRNGEIVD